MNKPDKRLLVFIAVLLLLVLTAGCAGPSAGMDDDVFSIYLAAGENAGGVPDDLDEIELRVEPWLTIDDIDFYDYSTHYIFLKGDTAPAFPADMPTFLLYPFVVVAGGERCYAGNFVSPVSSYAPSTPVIMMDGTFNFYPQDIIFIQEGFFSRDGADVRDDERVREALLESGKLRESVNIELNDVEIISRRAGEATLSYTFTITNIGDEALYMPDPDKMGSDLFHYYTNGIYLEKTDNPRVSIWAEQKSVTAPQPYDSWEASWFTRLDGGESTERTVTLDGYPEIPPGTYACDFAYSGPSHIEKNERPLPDGRLWLGMIESTTFQITVEN